jgi:hypothetical protein
MFEDLQQLVESFLLYKEGKEYKYNQSTMMMEYWAEEKALKLENESIKSDYIATSKELE